MTDHDEQEYSITMIALYINIWSHPQNISESYVCRDPVDPVKSGPEILAPENLSCREGFLADTAAGSI